MRMRKTFALVSVLFAASFICSSIAFAAPRELKLNVTTSEASVWMVGAREFKRLIEEKAGDRFKISIFPSEQLSGGDLVKGVEMLFTNVTDLDFHSVINMTSFEPKLTVVTMPWLFPKGYQSVDEILFNGAGGVALRKLIERKGAHVIGFGENGFRQITNSIRPIKSLGDIKGMKIRVPPINMYVDLFKVFGADPTVMSYSEVFTALQQKTIDGQENPLDTIRSAKFQEVQKYISLWNYSYDPFAFSVSGKVWKSLSDADKALFESAGVAAMKKQVAASRALDGEILKTFAKSMEITKIEPAEIVRFRDAAAPVYAKFKDKIGVDLFKAFGYTFK